MNNSGNQIKKKIIASYPNTDKAKLAGLERFIHKEFPNIRILLEPYLVFSKGEDSFLGWSLDIYGSQKHIQIHHPDMLLMSKDALSLTIFELDGEIHDIKTEKTLQRNKRYELNHLRYIVINEADLKFKLGLKKSKKLSQTQINTELKTQLEKLEIA